MEDNSNFSKRSAAKGIAILSIAMLLVKLMSLLYVPFLRAILKEEGMGVYYSCYQIFQYFYIIANAGLPVAISKIVSEYVSLGNYRDAVRTFKMARAIAFLIGIVLSAVLLIFASPLAKSMNSEQSTYALMVLSPTIFITTILCAYKGYYQGLGNMTPTAVSQVAEQVFNIVFSLGFAYVLIKFGNALGAAGGTVGTTLGALVALLYFLRYYKVNSKKSKKATSKNIKRSSNKEIFKKILFYAIPITIGMAIQQAGTLVDLKIVKERLLAASFSKTDIEILWGILSQYTVLINVPLALVSSISISVVPMISSQNATKSRGVLKDSIDTTMKVTYLITVPAAVGMAVFSLPILQLLKLDSDIAKLLMYGSYIIVLMAIVYLQTSILQGIGKVNAVTFFSVVGLVGKIIANYVFVAMPKLNILGAIIGSGISFLIMLVLNQILINRELKIRVKVITPVIRPIIASFVMAVISFAIYKGIIFTLFFIPYGYIKNAIAILIAMVIAMVVYGVSIILIGGVKKEDLQILPAKLIRMIPKRLLVNIK